MQAEVDRPALGRRAGPRRARRRRPTACWRWRADLTVAADGRASRVRVLAGLAVRELGSRSTCCGSACPSRAGAADHAGLPRRRRLVLTIDRGDYYQGGMLIPKGGRRSAAAGLPALRAAARARPPPFLRDVVGTLGDWDQVKLLSVQVNRLRAVAPPGLLCIGDAAHAMSPAFGVGVNYAVQDAIAAANLLAADLRRGVGARRGPRAGAAAARAAGAADAADPAAAAPARDPPRRAGGPGARGLPAPVRLLGRAVQPVVQRARGPAGGPGVPPGAGGAPTPP